MQIYIDTQTDPKGRQAVPQCSLHPQRDVFLCLQSKETQQNSKSWKNLCIQTLPYYALIILKLMVSLIEDMNIYLLRPTNTGGYIEVFGVSQSEIWTLQKSWSSDLDQCWAVCERIIMQTYRSPGVCTRGVHSPDRGLSGESAYFLPVRKKREKI